MFGGSRGRAVGVVVFGLVLVGGCSSGSSDGGSSATTVVADSGSVSAGTGAGELSSDVTVGGASSGDGVVVTSTTLSVEQQGLDQVSSDLAGLQSRFEVELLPKVEYSKSVWVWDLGQLKAVFDEAQTLPDWSDKWKGDKAAVSGRVMVLMGPGIRAVGDPAQEGFPGVAGLLNTVPAEFPADVQGVQAAVTGGDLATAQSLVAGLQQKVADFEGVLVDQPAQPPVSGPPSATSIPGDVSVPLDQMTTAQLQVYTQQVVDEYHAAVAAEKKKKQQQQQQGSSGGSGSSGNSNSGGGSGNSGGGGDPTPEPVRTLPGGAPAI